mmetsp:Transcript_31655/g.71196  ORF Transcript_31655/g.71196 Transcript_31655/m.71196 type:complete len:108 (+) Transcript_31655:375-698(+)
MTIVPRAARLKTREKMPDPGRSFGLKMRVSGATTNSSNSSRKKKQKAEGVLPGGVEAAVVVVVAVKERCPDQSRRLENSPFQVEVVEEAKLEDPSACQEGGGQLREP